MDTMAQTELQGIPGTRAQGTQSEGWEVIAQRVWATLDRLAARQEEQQKEAERRAREAERRWQEIDRLFKEATEERKKTDRQMRETDKEITRLSKNIGGLNNSFGTLIENLMSARLWEKFAAYPYNLRWAYQRIKIYGDGGRVLTDIDILLTDDEYAMAVEVKEKLDKVTDVKHHLKRMELIKKYPPKLVSPKMHWLGAMAGGEVNPDVGRFAHEKGFLVLELAGEAVRLIKPPAGFTPREW
jgi:hypothetical protein